MKTKTTKLTILALMAIVATFILFGSKQTVLASTDCTFTTVGTTMTLDGNCTTDATIAVPDGYTLDGAGYTITAVDPAGGHFTGAVVSNAGTSVHITNLTVTVSGLSNVCDAADNRLRGIYLNGASGTITNNNVIGINQGPSGCQEGNAIDVRNLDGGGTVTVEIAHNIVLDYQKTGIVANGDIIVDIHHNQVGASATQDNLAANSVQVAYGATGSVTHNNIEGNQWKGTSAYAATAMLIYLTNGLEISNNNIRGNSDVGLYLYGDNSIVDNNRIFDEGADHVNSDYDYGLGNWGADNSVTNNKVKGFEIAYDGVDDGNNKTIPGGSTN